MLSLNFHVSVLANSVGRYPNNSHAIIACQNITIITIIAKYNVQKSTQ